VEEPLRLLPPDLEIPPTYDPDDTNMVSIPRALVPIVGSLLRALEVKKGSWEQVALLLQARLVKKEE